MKKIIDRLAKWWLYGRHAPKPQSLYVDCRGPTPDRLGPFGATGRYIAQTGVVYLGPAIGFRTIVMRGKSIDEVNRQWHEYWKTLEKKDKERPAP